MENMEQENQQKTSESFLFEGSVPASFLDLLQHIDSENSLKANILTAICGAFLVLGFPQIDISDGIMNLHNIGWAVIIFGSMLTILSSLIAIKPRNKANKHMNLYYPGSYVGKISRDEYVVRFKEMFRNDGLVLDELAKELYAYGTIVRGDAKRVEFSFYVLGLSLVFGGLILMMSIFII